MEKTRKLITSINNTDVTTKQHSTKNSGDAQRFEKSDELVVQDMSLLKTFSKTKISKPMFQLLPSELIFKKFEPCQTYKTSLVLRNNDMVSRQVKVIEYTMSPYFELITPRAAGHHVAPGLQKIYKIHFTPSENKDYFHELVCITERESFIIPIKAIGPRASLDFPDEIHFPVCAVKNTSSKTLLIRNYGNREAIFTLAIERPFSLNPDRGKLAVEDSMQITISYSPETSSDIKTNLRLHYDTGEEQLIPVYGAAQDSNVRLDKNTIRFENTYISTSNQRTVTIQNRSSLITYYRWTQFATREEEEQQKLLQKMDLNKVDKTEADFLLDECCTNPGIKDRASILSRTFMNMKRFVKNDKFLFDDDVISIEPLEGEIWPNSSTDICIVFHPKRAQMYTRTAFCDITGRESRLPLCIHGYGQGPIIEVSVEMIHMGNIYIGAEHNYEFVLANKGDLNAVYTIMPKMSIYGPCFHFSPAESVIAPGGYQAIHVTFKDAHLGEFSEEFSIRIDGAPEPVKITFAGTVIGPTFQFDIKWLPFGTVSFGFPSTRSCILFNTSLVPMMYHLRIPSDGTVSSIPCMSKLSSEEIYKSLSTSRSLKEFEIVPAAGTLAPMSKQQVDVTLTSNTSKKYDVALVVDVQNVGEEVLSVNITARCVLPDITILTPVLNFERCFLRYSYDQCIKIKNATNLPAKYSFLVQEDLGMEDPPMVYYTPKPEGVIEEKSVLEMPLFIKAQKRDFQNMTIYIDMFGWPPRSKPINVTFIGEGPVVHLDPKKMDWGVMPVLTDIPRKLVLSNESVIPARFESKLLRANSVFRVEPMEGDIPARQCLDVTIIAYVDDCTGFENELQIDVIESVSGVIPLKVTGFGTTIVIDPPFTPKLNLGYYFSNRPLRKVFHVTNKGRRQQYLNWATEGYHIAKDKRKLMSFNAQDIKNKNVPPPPKPGYPVFKLIPNELDIAPGETVEMVIEGFVENAQRIHERLTCHCIVGRDPKELIMKVDITACCVNPLMEFSTKCLYFRVDMIGGQAIQLNVKELTMHNMSFLPLSATIALEEPFQIILDDGSQVSEMELYLDRGDKACLNIQFNHLYEGEFSLQCVDRILQVSYREHNHVDQVSLRAEVYFPTVMLDKSVVDFGCILNDTEVTRYMTMTNTSPMVVRYKWTFELTNEPCVVINQPPAKAVDEKVVVAAGNRQEENKEDSLVEESSNISKGFTVKDVEQGKQTGGAEDAEKEQTGLSLDNQNGAVTVEKTYKPAVQEQEEKEKGQLEVEAETTNYDSDGEGKTKQIAKEQERMEQGLDQEVEEEWNLMPLNAEEEALKANRALSTLLLQRREMATPASVEEVFDITPLYGVLEPDQHEQVTFTFFGHADISAHGKAVCEIQGGPPSVVLLKGEASSIEYHFDTKQIDFGQQIYDQVITADITLFNTGKIGFQFITINTNPSLCRNPPPGLPVLVPPSGFIEPMTEQKLTLKFMFGTPETFYRMFLIQVAHFEPDVIHLYGEGLFPRISLDLPRLIDESGNYYALLQKATEIKVKEAELKESKMKELETERLRTMAGRSETKRMISMETQTAEILQELEHKEMQVSESLTGVTPCKEVQTTESLHQIGKSVEAQTTESVIFSEPVRKGSHSKKSVLSAKEVGKVSLRSKASQTKESQMNDSLAKTTADEESQTNDVLTMNGNRSAQQSSPSATKCCVSSHSVADHGKYVGSFKPASSILDLEIELEAERLAVIEYEQKLHKSANLESDYSLVTDQMNSWLERLSPESKKNRRHVKSRFCLPEYILDFGHVILGTVQTRNVHAANTGCLPVSFNVEHKPLHKYGFSVQMDKVHNLPGPPDPETVDIVVSFDPSIANLQLGAVQKQMMINIENGPSVCIILKANVTMPKLQLSSDELTFGDVRCGECKIFTIQLYNSQPIPCEWSVEKDHKPLQFAHRVSMPVKKPSHIEKIRLPIFEVVPSSGTLVPHEKTNIQVRFMPSEEKYYDHRVQFRMIQSNEQIVLTCYGQGQEPRLHFAEHSLVFTPVLPNSGGNEKEITVRNPCPFPVEFYSVELDKIYVEEEKILKTLKCYDKYNRILLPIREPGERLPPEILDYYEDKMKKMDTKGIEISVTDPADEQDVSDKGSGVGELDVSPVSAVIARHLGIDLNTDVQVARNRRGIVILVHGPRKSGKTTTSEKLAEKYNSAVLVVDRVVMDAIAKGKSAAANEVWEKYLEFAREREREAKEAEDQENLGVFNKSQSIYRSKGSRINMKDEPAHKMSQTSRNKRKSVVMHKDKTVDGIPHEPKVTSATTLKSLITSQLAGWTAQEDLIETILLERAQEVDCEWGIIFDGLQTIFSPNAVSMANSIVKHFNERRFIFLVPLTVDEDFRKDSSILDLDERVRLALKAENAEREQLEEMSETEYDALTEEEKEEMDLRLLELRKRKRQRDDLAERKRREIQRKQEEAELEAQRERERELATKRKKIKQKASRERKLSSMARKTERMQSTSEMELLKSDIVIEDGKKKRPSKYKTGKDGEETEMESSRDLSMQLIDQLASYQQLQNEFFYMLDHWDRTVHQFQHCRSLSGNKSKEDEDFMEKHVKDMDKLKADRFIKEVLEGLGYELPIPEPLELAVVRCPPERTLTPIDTPGARYTLACSSQDDLYKDGSEFGKYGASRSRHKMIQKMKMKGDKTKKPSSGETKKSSDRQSVKFKSQPQAASKPNSRVDASSPEDANVNAQTELKPPKSPQDNSDDRKSESGDKTPKSRMKTPDRSGTEDKDRRLGRRAQSRSHHRQAQEAEEAFYRWLVPPQGKITLHLRFVASELGEYDQAFTFEVAATRKQYRINCHGVCAYPKLSQDISTIFPNIKKNKKPDELVYKQYIMKTKTFEFGPLLAAKSREKYREGNYPENMQTLKLWNISPLDADITFYYLNDRSGETFLVEPSHIVIPPGEKDLITVWAYPKTQGRFTDSLVCEVWGSPEPVTFDFACDAYMPSLELDKKLFNFEKVLLHRKESRSVKMRNKTGLPVRWKLDGLDIIGEDFSVAQHHGVVQPLSEFTLTAYFHPTRATILSKKFLKLLFFDADNILGIIQQEQIGIFAEAYDICLDIHFGKGTNCGLDFGTLLVFDEQKQTCTLRNRGKYPIGFSFSFENVDPSMPDVASLFTVIPQKGMLTAVDRSMPLYVTFRSTKELYMKEQPILHCQVVDCTTGKDGEFIADIPIKVSVNSVFSKFKVEPSSEIHFGSLLPSTRTFRHFTIENQGEFEFKYTLMKEENPQPTSSSAQQSSSSHSSQQGIVGRPSNIRPDYGTHYRTAFGIFVVSPAFGIIYPNNQTTITVECITEWHSGRFKEELLVDVTHRNPWQYPNGLPFRLVADVYFPSINTDNLASVFEEHRVCKTLALWQHQHEGESEGVFGEDERRFVFNNVFVGRRATARFKISNTGRVPSDVVMSLKPSNPSSTDVFEVEPARGQIPINSHMFVTVTFIPPSMNKFSSMLEVFVESNRNKLLMFEVSGEGNLPRVRIHKPAVRNKRGLPIMLFKKILLGRTQTLPFTLFNDGTLACKVFIELIDPEGIYKLKSTEESMPKVEEAHVDPKTGERLYYPIKVDMQAGEFVTYDVVFSPTATKRYEAGIKVLVMDNKYENLVIQMVGEGYADVITLDNIHSLGHRAGRLPGEESAEEEDIQAAKPNLIDFGDSYLNEPKTLTFTMTNHSKVDNFKFRWAKQDHLQLSPRTGHLRANNSKTITVTFLCQTPITLTEHQILCSVSKIVYTKPNEEVADWDDRLRTVKWISTAHVCTEACTEQPCALLTPQGPLKKKVVEPEPEPEHTLMDGTTRTVELLVSGIADYCRYKCDELAIRFKDTLMFQTRVFQMKLMNEGKILMDFKWKIVMDNLTPIITVNKLTPTLSSEKSKFIDASYVPFSIEPLYGTVGPGKTVVCTIKFSPLDVNEYEARLMCRIPNLENDERGPVVELKARSLMPYCHFELQESDYLLRAARNSPRTKNDPNLQVIEFTSIGTPVKAVREFNMLNPTKLSYKFEWVCEDKPDIKTPTHFQCLYPTGEIQGRKKFKAAFEFTSSDKELVESSWTFKIAEKNITVPFLLVGNMIDPRIIIDRSHLTFNCLIGNTVKETVYLINSETIPLRFSFEKRSINADGYSCPLVLGPMSGKVPAKSKMPVSLAFTPNIEKLLNFNLLCKVKTKPQHLRLNVKGEGYSVRCSVYYEHFAGQKVELGENNLSVIDLGETQVNGEAMRNLFLVNAGKFHFSFHWELPTKCTKKNMITMFPEDGEIQVGKKQTCRLSFCPSSPVSINCDFLLKISNGPTYSLKVLGVGVTPSLNFSFESYQFGVCFVHQAGMPEYSTVLEITNKEEKDISLSCLYDSTKHLHHNFKSGVIKPGETQEVTFTFYPRDAVKYHETVIFDIDGLNKRSVEFYGQGTDLKIEVADPKFRMVNLGARSIGDEVKKVIPIVNRSLAPIEFKVGITRGSKTLLPPSVLNIQPQENIVLQPKGGSASIEVNFKPRARILQFTEEVFMGYHDLTQPLFLVKGLCLGMEISLGTELVVFGAVVKNGQSVRKVVMYNTGDMNAKFRWDIKRFAPDFSISPVEGYSTAGGEVTFDVTFQPQEISSEIKYEKLECFLKGGDHPPLTMTLYGICTSATPYKDTQFFQTNVRQKDMKNIPIHNRTNQLWELKPVIDGDQWSGPPFFTVEPQQSKHFPIVYKPLTMTKDTTKKHQGSLFFALPDGRALLFSLMGTSDSPKPNEKIQREIPCKTSYVEILPVKNWLKKQQRFRVKTEVLKADKADPGIIVKGMDFIDVPANSKKNYKLSFYSYKEVYVIFKVTFTNEHSGEFQFYELLFRSTKPDVISTIELTTRVREAISHTIAMSNPLTHAITMTVQTTLAEVQVPALIALPPEKETDLTLEYFPLKVGNTRGRLEFGCTDLGVYPYDLDLTATPAAPEKPLYFRTFLGQSHVQVAKFSNCVKQKTEYVCKVDNPDFSVSKSITVSGVGTEVTLEVVFEPSEVSEQRAMLTFTSPVGGEFCFPLFGSCLPPKPQGPFVVRVGSQTNIIFRNIFRSATQFLFQVDNPLFSLMKYSDTLRSRKDYKINISFTDNSSSNSKKVKTSAAAPVTAQLIVTCAHSAGGSNNAEWVYYLKGVTQ
ncbi:hydrocephalus-inducing protein-like isoform X3 [Gigantopelta aegis]|uniref:hydrocephalus-inducing protein-like isoform X3 n=1 Tax=Gigantopelta aegis TaxID=1735272 RepID=UPI001B88D04B|nr:hydrocephalus-inducing protein-like isoform X3 [Gigantopelta aegis]